MTGERGTAVGGLEALIGDLWQLYLTLSSVVVNMRTDHREKGGGDTLDIKVVESLNARIEKLKEQNSSEGAGLFDEPAVALPDAIDVPVTATAKAKGNALSGGAIFTELSNYLKNRSSATISQPYIAEKLKTSAEVHINKSISLAKLGNYEAAGIHARLAESAVKTAAAYMSVDAYEDFKRRIHERIDSTNKSN